ncbi:hypothetical protein KIP69_08635 [Geobacter sulfurreducens]|uniref:ribbon-helix-helix domain-containing protein n=1 Tax=Geobacter sulfurreducens TaxID=35554 RepID=UPI001BDC4E0B|nr:hypothetical protein KIP69_08635 [Geobacter sulfurreducens]
MSTKRGGLLSKKAFCRLTDLEYGELERWADKEGFPVSTILRHLVRRALEDRQRFGRVGKWGVL